MNTQAPTIYGDLAGRLKAVQSNYFLGLASICLMNSPRAPAILQKGRAQFGRYIVPFDQIASLIAIPTHRDEALNNFLLTHMCAMLKDAFEMCRHHCKTAGRLSEMRAEPWYQFFRIVRNCIAHSCLFEFSAHDLAMLPITWRGLAITADFAGKPMSLEFLGYARVWELFVEIQTFAERTAV